MSLAENQHTVQDLAAQGADKALADRLHARCLDGGAQDPGARSLEDGVKGAGEFRPAVADQEPNVLEPLAETEGQVAGLLHSPLARAPAAARRTGALPRPRSGDDHPRADQTLPRQWCNQGEA